MNIIVCAKQVVDVSEIKIDSNTKKPILQGIPQKISDIDKNALEEAIKIKEKHGGKITVITAGPTNAKERIKELLAMGADEGILIILPEKSDYHITSNLLAGVIKKIGKYDIILCGEASIDMFSGQIGPRLAGLLNVPQITYAQKINAEKDKITAEEIINRCKNITECEVSDIKEVIEKKTPYHCFNISTCEQESWKYLHYTPKFVDEHLQQLYSFALISL